MGMRLRWARLFLALWLSLSMVFSALAQDEGGERPAVIEDTEEVSQEPPSEEAPAEAEAIETVEPPAAVPAPAPLSDREVAAQVGPSVVQILVPSGSGSGVKIEGGVLTNEHVVRGLAQVEIVRNDGRRVTGPVAKCDSKLDLALIQTDLEIAPLILRPAALQSQGDAVLVLGYPRADVLGGQPTLTGGRISALRRDEDDRFLVQTDAAMNPGSSGGAMVNQQGELIALATFGLRGTQGLNFGVATESILEFLAGAAGPCPVATPTATPAPTPGVGGVLISDNFDDESRGVLPRASPDPTRWHRGYLAGEYRMQIFDPAWTGAPFATLPGSYANAALAVDARVVGAAAARNIFLSCREQPDGSGYLVLVAPEDGVFALVRLDQATAVPLLTFQPSATIRRGNASNRLELACAGDAISVSVNGTPVTSVRDSTYREGRMSIGFVARNNAGEVRFDNLIVTRR